MLWPFRPTAGYLRNLATSPPEKQRALSATALLERMLACSASTPFRVVERENYLNTRSKVCGRIQ